MSPTLLQFVYVNHRGETHTYLVRPVNVEFGKCEVLSTSPDRETWMLRAMVITRDGEFRSGERSFVITDLRDIQERQGYPGAVPGDFK